MKRLKNKKNNEAFSLVEILISAFIISMAAVAILNAYGYLIRTELASAKYLKASYLLDEGVEAVRYMRNKSWSANILPLSTTTNYYLYASTSAGTLDWRATTTRQLYDNFFERKLNFSGVYRDGSQNIVLSGGTLDTNITKLTVSVSWLGVSNATTTKTVSKYVTNFYQN